MAETRNSSTRLTLFAESGEAALQWIRGALAAIRVLRLPLVISLVASAVLLLPLQTLELYRVLAQDVVSRSKSEPHWYDLMFAAAGTPEMVFGIAGLLLLTFCIWYVTHRLTGLLGDLVPKSSQTGTTLLLAGPAVLSVLPLLAVATALHAAGHYDDIDQAGPITVLQNLADQKQAELVSELLNSFDRLKDLLAAGAIISAALGFCILLLALRLAYRRRGSHASPGISVLEVLACWSFFAATVTAVILFPVAFPQAVGVLAITGLFFGGLALVSGQLNVWAERTRVPIIIPLVLVALALSAFDLNDNHVIRNLALNSTTQFRALDVFRLPTAADQFEDWYLARADREDYRDRKYPVYIVAAQGGGIYAAAHLALFMTLMQEACPKFAQHTFAISSVSGGSIGAAWFTALARKYARNARVSCTPASDLDTDAHSDMYQDARSLLERDYLSPLISGALLPDFLQRFLPLPVSQLSRARAFELSLEEAWTQLAARAEGDEPKNPLASGFLEHWDPSQSAPALLVNATEVGSGRRRIVAPFTFAIGNAGFDDIAFMPIARSNDIPLSTVVSLSARFPWISPAGWFNEVDKEGGIHKVRLVDGGYFDNSGVATAVDLIGSLRGIKSRSSGAPLPVDINLIVLSTGKYADQRFFGFGEALSPIEALLNSRSAETSLTIDRASDLLGSLSPAGGKDGASDGLAVPRLRRVHVGDFVFRLPLGWRLSQSTSQLIEMQSGHGTHCVPDGTFSQSTDALSYFDGDCVQSLIYHELSGDSLQEAATKLRAARTRLSPAERCADIDTLRSIGSFIRETSVLFINNTDTPKKLYWLEDSHKQIDYGDIAAHAARQQDTFYSHPWIVREQNGECFGVFVPQPSESAIWLGSRNIKSPVERCSDPSALRSVEGDSHPTHVDFVNDTQAPKSLFWLDYEGSPQLYATIAPGESHPQDTYVTHAWMVKDEAGECVGVYFPNSTPTKFNLKPSPSYAGPPSRAR